MLDGLAETSALGTRVNWVRMKGLCWVQVGKVR